ncbi:unnamed protein product [Fraxinus pennsylvanica]|uniref:Glutaredoxin domain-containing protein n=1 Tax=Fraxinus pennsylvanica TaxID=56036 RepID=A0AAD2A6N0_9LAMI|nr:unnamed protein product [Fraxinus pennsylvanica]
MKARILRKLKNISIIAQKQDLVLHPNSFFQASTPHKEHSNDNLPNLVASNINVSGLVNNVPEDEFSSVSNVDTEEKFRPYIRLTDNDQPAYDQVQLLSEVDHLVEIGKSACQPLMGEIEGHSELIPVPCFKLNGMEDSRSHERKEENDEFPSISEFEEMCPPGGTDSVILYTTSLRGIRKTFEDCKAIQFLLESFRVLYYERDVSMHLEYRDELWRVLGGRVVPPRLFIRGRDIGGADAVVGLHEKGMLRKLLQGISLTQSNTPCNACAGMHFVLCFHCNGSRKITPEGQANVLSSIRCPDCNENGLIKCTVCS